MLVISDKNEPSKMYGYNGYEGTLSNKELDNFDELGFFNCCSFSLPSISLPSITFPKISFPKIDWPRIDLPKISLPSITLPTLSIPGIKIPTFEDIGNQLSRSFKDVVTVGGNIYAATAKGVSDVTAEAGRTYKTVEREVGTVVAQIPVVREAARIVEHGYKSAVHEALKGTAVVFREVYRVGGQLGLSEDQMDLIISATLTVVTSGGGNAVTQAIRQNIKTLASETLKTFAKEGIKGVARDTVIKQVLANTVSQMSTLMTKEGMKMLAKESVRAFVTDYGKKVTLTELQKSQMIGNLELQTGLGYENLKKIVDNPKLLNQMVDDELAGKSVDPNTAAMQIKQEPDFIDYDKVQETYFTEEGETSYAPLVIIAGVSILAIIALT